jgi:hypothetical protein
MYQCSGSASASGFGSVSQWYGSEDPHPDPYYNVTNPQHWKIRFSVDERKRKEEREHLGAYRI